MVLVRVTFKISTVPLPKTCQLQHCGVVLPEISCCAHIEKKGEPWPVDVEEPNCTNESPPNPVCIIPPRVVSGFPLVVPVDWLATSTPSVEDVDPPCTKTSG
jgi:hypothetical protein